MMRGRGPHGDKLCVTSHHDKLSLRSSSAVPPSVPSSVKLLLTQPRVETSCSKRVHGDGSTIAPTGIVAAVADSAHSAAYSLFHAQSAPVCFPHGPACSHRAPLRFPPCPLCVARRSSVCSCMFPASASHVPCFTRMSSRMFPHVPACSPHVPCMISASSMHVPRMFPACSPHVPACSQHVPRMFPACSPHVPFMFLGPVTFLGNRVP